MTKAVEAFLTQERVAVVGVSRRSRLKIGRLLFDALRRRAGEVVPINPAAEAIDGVRCFPDIRSAGDLFGAVFITVPWPQARECLEQCAELGIRNVWLVGGAAASESLAFCREKGIAALYGSCPIQWVAPHSFHWPHRILSELLRLFPKAVDI